MKKLILILLLCSTAFAGRYEFGTAVCEDAYFLASAPTTNYGSEVYLIIDGDAATSRGAVIRFANVYDSLYVDAGGNITVESCSLRVHCVNGCADAASVAAYRMFKTTFVESEVTWNIWSTGNAWGSAGCNILNDGGSDNATNDAASDDRKETAEGSASVNGGSAYYNIPISVALLQDRFDTDAPLCLYLCRTADYPTLTSSEGGNPPLLIVNYSLAAPASNEDVKIGNVKLGSGVKLDN